MTQTVQIDPAVRAEFAALQNANARTTAVIRASVRTGIFDAIEDDARPITSVASRAGLHVDALRRVLRFLESEGYVVLDGDHVRATDRTRFYRRESMLWASLAHLGSLEVAHALDHTLRTGSSAWEHVHGTPFFDWLAAHPEQEQIFAESMRHEGTLLNLVAVPSIDLSGSTVVADIGGGTGDLLSALLAANPHTTGVLVDLPSVLDQAVVDEDRCTLHAADLFGTMPSADAYVLARILHDWSDDDSARILRGIRAAAPTGARLFDLDLVVPPGPETHISKQSDIGMMLLFGGGRERTREEFAELFASTGWRLADVIELPISSLLIAVAE